MFSKPLFKQLFGLASSDFERVKGELVEASVRDVFMTLSRKVYLFLEIIFY